MVNLNEQQLKSFVNLGKFPIYIYWNAANNSFTYHTEKKVGAIGCFWDDPFKIYFAVTQNQTKGYDEAKSETQPESPQKSATPDLSKLTSEEEIAEKYSLSMTDISSIKEIIVEKYGVTVEKVIPQASFMNHLGFDSLDIAEMASIFEKKFEISISYDEGIKIFTVVDLYVLIAEKLAQKNSEVNLS